MGRFLAPDQSSPAIRRFFAFALVRLVIELVVIVSAAILVQKAVHLVPHERESPFNAILALLSAVVVALVYVGCCHWLERRQGGGDFAGKNALRELGGGLLVGFLLFGAMAGCVALLGGLELIGVRGLGQLWSIMAMAVFSGVIEEVMFRGIVFRHLEAMLGSWGALALTSVLFGAAHLSNPNASLFAAAAIALEAGLMLGGSYLLTRRLWLPIGIHAAWNFTQGWVFSVPVSGTAPPLGLLITRRVGPDWLTGGDFGLEASVVAMVLATIAGGVLVGVAAKCGKIASGPKSFGRAISA